MKIRSPIVSVLGHVDHGKTTLLDYIRGSTIADKEAGGITQHIGATEIPIDTLNEIGGDFISRLSIKDTIPGLFFVDTPGHAAFTSLRKRGGALADLAILIVDINEGFKPQTIEAINILKMYKTPFIVAANKMDRLFGWDPVEGASFTESYANQAARVKTDLDLKVYELVGLLHEHGFQSERFDRVTDFASQIAIVPISAKTGEGVIELIAMLLGLAQQYLTKQLEIHEDEPAKGTILEVKEEVGLGITVDSIIYDGVLRSGDELALMTSNDVITTNIRSILKPRPLEEIRESKNRFEKVDEVVAAAGIKISAPNLDDVVSGSPLRVVTDKEDAKSELLEELNDITVNTDDEGIEEYGVIIAFNVKIHPKAMEDLKNAEIQLFSSDIIYQIMEDYDEWLKARKEAEKKAWLDAIIKPAKFMIIPKLVFRQSKPAICGIEVEAGTVKKGQPLMNQNGDYVGTVASMEDNGESLTAIFRGQRIAMAINDAVAGKDFEEGDSLYIDVPEKHFKVLQREFKDKLDEDEFRVLEELTEIKRRRDTKSKLLRLNLNFNL